MERNRGPQHHPSVVMASFPAYLDVTRRVRLTPRVARAFWSRERAWPQDTVTVTVETRYVPDDSEVNLEIRLVDQDPGDDPIAVVEGLTVTDGRCTVEHEIAWDPDAVVDALTPEHRRPLFCFDVVIDAYELRHRSTPLYLPLEPLVASH